MICQSVYRQTHELSFSLTVSPSKLHGRSLELCRLSVVARLAFLALSAFVSANTGRHVALLMTLCTCAVTLSHSSPALLQISGSLSHGFDVGDLPDDAAAAA